MRKILVAACAAPLLLTGCGGGAEDTTAPSSTTSELATTTEAAPGKTDPETFNSAIQVLNYLHSQDVICENTDSIDLGLTCETPDVSYIVNADPTGERVKTMVDAANGVDDAALIYGDRWYISCSGATAQTACFFAGDGLTSYEKAGF